MSGLSKTERRLLASREILGPEATDGATPTAGTGTATITVTVTDVDETPAFGATSYSQCILDGSAAETTLTTTLATDSDPGDKITHSINCIHSRIEMDEIDNIDEQVELAPLLKFQQLMSTLINCLHLITDATITGWTTPTIEAAVGTGTLTVSESQATLTTITTYVAVTSATSITYAFASAVAPFDLSSTGVLTITANLDADTTSSYTLNVVATDDNSAVGTATIAVTVTDIDDAPAFGATSYSQCIIDGSAADTTLTTLLATDSDPGDTITHNINSGNTNTDFKIDATTGVIQVNTGKTLAMATTASYTLVIHAVDDESTAQTGSTTVSVTVAAECSSAAALGFSVTAIFVTMLVSVL
ncbi:protocadherin Fat 4-like [Mercenaria mercenaria]|uniref:protocadherin Fat 4-like n=1 Tax=Mercenaria mercenaria TaxID=6596 RepID=UPI00234F9814|nr:protocadherin Fat 4-like [Mercenaria mercenaria]